MNKVVLQSRDNLAKTIPKSESKFGGNLES